MQPALCSYPTPQLLFFSDNVPKLVYYSHLPIIFIALLLGFFVFKKGKGSLPNKIMFSTLLAFAVWVILDSVFWAANRSDVIMFVWSLQVLIEPLVHVSALYLLQVLVNKRDTAFGQKIVLFLLYVPIIMLAPTQYILSGFDLSTCLSNETIFSYYTYVLEIIFTIWILVFGLVKYKQAVTKEKKKEIMYLTLGIIFFLIAFSWGAITGSFTEDWNLAQAGLIGMPIFAIFLVYTIVKYKTFHMKLMASQALVVALVILIGAQFAFIQNNTSRILNGFTFLGAIIFGILLIKSVKREVEQRERLEKLTLALESANTKLEEVDKAKTEFLSLASHQLRSPITAIKGYTSMFLEGSYGEVSEVQREPISRVFQSSLNLANVVEDLLDVAKIEQGGMKYVMQDVDLETITSALNKEFSLTAKSKGLELKYENAGASPCMVSVDPVKFRQVVLNLLDNSIKYTQTGFVKLSITKKDGNAVVSISDSGMGMSPETQAKLFGKFSRGEGMKVNAGGSGIGLYLAKEIVEAHKGTVTASSEGVGKGSTFAVTIPLKK